MNANRSVDLNHGREKTLSGSYQVKTGHNKRNRFKAHIWAFAIMSVKNYELCSFRHGLKKEAV